MRNLSWNGELKMLQIDASIEEVNGHCYMMIGDLKIKIDSNTYTDIYNEQIRIESYKHEEQLKLKELYEDQYAAFYSKDDPYNEK